MNKKGHPNSSTIAGEKSDPQKEKGYNTLAPAKSIPAVRQWLATHKALIAVIGFVGTMLFALAEPLIWGMQNLRIYPFIVAVVVALFFALVSGTATYWFVTEIVIPAESSTTKSGAVPATQQVAPNAIVSAVSRGPKILLKSPEAYVVVGPVVFVIRLDDRGNAAAELPISAGIPDALVLEAKNYVLYAKADVTDGISKARIQTLANENGDIEIDKLPYNWDVNHDSSAIEIIDGSGLPVFQMEYISDLALRIRGTFVAKTDVGGLVLHEPGATGFSALEPLTKFRQERFVPIFKYPSTLRYSLSKLDGERAGPVPEWQEIPHLPRMEWNLPPGTTIPASAPMTNPSLRTLSDSQRAILIKRLSLPAFSGQEISVQSVPGDENGFKYKAQLAAALRAANWKVYIMDIIQIPEVSEIDGVTVCVNPEDSANRASGAAGALMGALAEAGMAIHPSPASSISVGRGCIWLRIGIDATI